MIITIKIVLTVLLTLALIPIRNRFEALRESKMPTKSTPEFLIGVLRRKTATSDDVAIALGLFLINFLLLVLISGYFLIWFW